MEFQQFGACWAFENVGLENEHTCVHACVCMHTHTYIMSKMTLAALTFKMIYKLRGSCRKMCSLVIHFSRTYFLSYIIWNMSFSIIRFVPIYILHAFFSISLL